MPNKYPAKKGWKVPKQRYKVSNWTEYNQALCRRGDINIWLSEDAINSWYESERIYDGTGSPKKYSDFAIITCHEIRQVYRLPLRQCQGFIDSLFLAKKIPISCPDYTCLSKRLASLNIRSPRYIKTDRADESVATLTIDSTGLKRFGKGEWHVDKYKISAKRSWRKLHVAVDDNHLIHASTLTDRFVADEKQIDDLTNQITIDVNQVTADGAYDKIAVYNSLTEKFPCVDVVIPPHCDAVYNKDNHPMRNRNLQEIKTFGRMNWQRARDYGKRNNSELCMLRYKKILGNSMHARDFLRQKNESMLGCGILNKMTGLGMPASYRAA